MTGSAQADADLARSWRTANREAQEREYRTQNARADYLQRLRADQQAAKARDAAAAGLQNLPRAPAGKDTGGKADTSSNEPLQRLSDSLKEYFQKAEESQRRAKESLNQRKASQSRQPSGDPNVLAKIQAKNAEYQMRSREQLGLKPKPGRPTPALGFLMIRSI